MATIARREMVEFFAWSQDEYFPDPDGVPSSNKKPLTPKTIRNIHTNLSALWAWTLADEFVDTNMIQDIDEPPASPPVIEPFTKDDVASFLRACEVTRSWKEACTGHS